MIFFYLIWKGVCYYLLVIKSNLDPISHRLATIARTDLEGHSKSMISILLETAYATSY